MYSIADVSLFSDLFRGNTEAIGVTEVGEIIDDKAQSKSKLVYEAPTPSILERHLNGDLSIGLAPIKSNGCCSFAAIDIDSPVTDLLAIVRAIYEYNIPIAPCWSKSKKLHLYFFFSDEPTAQDVIDHLKWFIGAFGLDAKTEIFPKQRATSAANKFYSWINIPYFDAFNMTNHRKLVKADGSLALFSDALDYMNNIKITFREHKQWIEDFEYHDAPPCVLSSILLHDIGPGMRNNWLYSVGVYLRLKDENCDLGSVLSEINNQLDDPLPERELQETIIKGFQRKSYYYNCNQALHCNKQMCRNQNFGIESKASTGLDYGDLTQYMTDPPYYEWIINGQTLSFWSEREILTQGKFRALCLRQLHIVPRQVDDERWTKILNRACSNITVVEGTTEGDDFTSGSTFMDLVTNFFNNKRKADNPSQINMGRVYHDVESGEYIFTAKALMEYITIKNDFKQYTPVEIRSRMFHLGAYKDEGKWRIPVKSIPKPDAIPEIDFRDKEDPNAAF